MIMQSLPSRAEMLRAFNDRDARFDGIFFTGVRTTGIFCRPTCSARKPAPENVEFFHSVREAVLAGYRACKRCRPLEPAGTAPAWIRPLMQALQEDPARRWKDRDLRTMGIDPARVRRWFRANHGMSFHAYHRAHRIGRAIGQIREGAKVTAAAFDAGYESLSGFYDAVQLIIGSAPHRVPDTATLVHIDSIPTPLGTMLAAATDDALCLLEFTDRRMLETQLSRMAKLVPGALVPGENAVLRETRAQLAAYYEGRLQEFTVPLALLGSPFQQDVWRALQTIPYGETRSYAQQSLSIGRPEAVRAVARANGDNRIAIIIPCHRVVGSDGKLTGYGGGLWRKKALLEHEQRHASLRLI